MCIPEIAPAIIKRWISLDSSKGLKPWVAGRFAVDPDDDVFFGRESHTTAAPLNFSRSMRYLFDAPRCSLQGWERCAIQIISMHRDDFPREMFSVKYSRQYAVGRLRREPKRRVECAHRGHGLKVEKI